MTPTSGFDTNGRWLLVHRPLLPFIGEGQESVFQNRMRTSAVATGSRSFGGAGSMSARFSVATRTWSSTIRSMTSVSTARCDRPPHPPRNSQRTPSKTRSYMKHATPEWELSEHSDTARGRRCSRITSLPDPNPSVQRGSWQTAPTRRAPAGPSRCHPIPRQPLQPTQSAGVPPCHGPLQYPQQTVRTLRALPNPQGWKGTGISV